MARQTGALASVLALFLGALVIATPLPGAAEVLICNHAQSGADIAVAYRGAPAQGWVTDGWKKLAADKCMTLFSGTATPQPYYLRVDTAHGGFGGPTKFCVMDINPFSVTHAEVTTQKDVTDCNQPTHITAPNGVPIKSYVVGFVRVDRGKRNSVVAFNSNDLDVH